ncbi:MAG: ribose-phosphate diphosphokinase, partial [Patescibacteria group bacterium]
LGRYRIVRYPDGEWTVRLASPVRGDALPAGRQALVVGNITPSAESLLELVALVHALDEAGARVSLAIPHLAFARLDRLTGRGESALGVAIARLLATLPVRRITVLDVHSDAILRALGPRAKNLSALSHVAALLRNVKIDTVVAPDRGALPRARKLAALLPGRVGVAWIEKTRLGPGKTRAEKLHGTVRGKSVLVVDDMIDSGDTIRTAVRLLGASGASHMRVAATHGIFSKGARAMLARLPIRELIITDSLPQQHRRGLRVIHVAPIVIS